MEFYFLRVSRKSRKQAIVSAMKQSLLEEGIASSPATSRNDKLSYFLDTLFD